MSVKIYTDKAVPYTHTNLRKSWGFNKIFAKKKAGGGGDCVKFANHGI